MAPPKVTVETITRMAEEIVGVPVGAQDRKAVAELLQGLATDMDAFRRVSVGSAEPATSYDAGEAES
jgi:hypothetical protein